VRPFPLPGFEELVSTLIAAGPGVVMTMGKGGVGKTSLAVAIARALARAGQAVHLTTTDPATDLMDALGDARPDGLTADVISPAAETRRYTAEVLALAGELDPGERELLEEDLRSPCTEEIAVFRAFARRVAGAEKRYLLLDTAPTGHTLLLLDAAQSYQREVARTSAEVPSEVRALLSRLRDPAYCRVLVVTLPETTPVAEAERLQADLRRAGIEPFGWVINASLAVAGTHHPVLAARAVLEEAEISRVAGELARQAWILPWSASAPAA
jgi:arsenite-transporting ATPase